MSDRNRSARSDDGDVGTRITLPEAGLGIADAVMGSLPMAERLRLADGAAGAARRMGMPPLAWGGRPTVAITLDISGDLHRHFVALVERVAAGHGVDPASLVPAVAAGTLEVLELHIDAARAAESFRDLTFLKVCAVEELLNRLHRRLDRRR
jgi:hypothetical protein